MLLFPTAAASFRHPGDAALKLWDAQTGAELRAIPLAGPYETDVDGLRFFSRRPPHRFGFPLMTTLKLWDVQRTGAQAAPRFAGHAHGGDGLRFFSRRPPPRFGFRRSDPQALGCTDGGRAGHPRTGHTDDVHRVRFFPPMAAVSFRLPGIIP